jgi:hypothetical protein
MIRQVNIGKYNVCLDVNRAGDLQIRVYPIDNKGIIWDCPYDTFDVSHADIIEAEIIAAEQAAEEGKK